jgi:transposase
VRDFHREFPNDDVCLDTIFKERYGDVDTCPSCHVKTKFHRLKGRKSYSCQWCGYQLHPLSGTIFHKSSTPLTSWFYAMYLFSTSRNGVSAAELQRHLGVTNKCAHRIARKIRSLMAEDGIIGGEGTIVEADETYYGGRKSIKTPIMGVVERGGKVRAKVTDTASTARVKTFFKEHLHPGSELHTDESRIYWWTNSVMEHYSVNHSQYEFAWGHVTTNTIEGFWSQLKRSLDGTHHSVSRQHLQSYVDEFVFRYNLRGEAVYPVLLERASKPLKSAA